MKWLFTILALASTNLLFGQNYGSKIDPSTGFNDRLKSASSRIESIVCDFEQVKFISVLANPNKSRGKFYYKKEQNICLEYSNPQGNAIVMNGVKFKMIANGKTTVVGMKANPMMRQLGSMLAACMTGNIALFGKESRAEYYESSTYFTVVINPTSSRVKSHLKRIILQFEKKDMTLSMMRMEESDTDYTQYLFDNKKLNGSIDGNKFKI